MNFLFILRTVRNKLVRSVGKMQRHFIITEVEDVATGRFWMVMYSCNYISSSKSSKLQPARTVCWCVLWECNDQQRFRQ